MKLKRYILPVILLVLSGALPLHAEEQAGAGQPPTAETLNRLRRLKEENPEEFRRLIQERKNQIKSKVQEFRQSNPEKFKGFHKRVSEKRMDRLKKMKQENPQAFERDMRGRAEGFKRMQKENPERFQKFLEKHPKVNERMNQNSFQKTGERSGHGMGSELQAHKENFRDRKEDSMKDGAERREQRQENPAAKNDSQFIQRPDFRKNSGEFSTQDQSSQVQRASGFKPREGFSKNHPQVREQAEQRSGQNFRLIPQGRDRGQDFAGASNAGSKPSQGAKPARGGSGDGARRHSR